MKENKKVVLITGASSGIGAAIAKQIAARHTVIGTSRRSQTPASFSWEQLDVCDHASIKECVKGVLEAHGRIDALINNAGLGMVSSLEEAPIENVRQLMDTNLYGTLQLIQEVLPSMRQQGSGQIINVSSIAGLMGLPYRSIYAASKFAVEGLTESLRTEVRQFGIEVCTVQPGSIRTDISARRVSHLPVESPYNPELQDVEKFINEEVRKGIPSQDVAVFVENLLSRRKLASKYVVAKPFQKLVANPLRRLLPRSVFEKLLCRHYGLKS